jgi:glycosyltransferase involved in cell wall biosynthesis
MGGRSVIPGLVSTVIPVYNRPQMLGEAVESVLAQTYRHFEVVIVNDGSTDETSAVAKKYVRDYPQLVSLINDTNSGPGAARERGRRAASGEYIQYLDSDDILDRMKFDLQVRILETDSKVGVAYCKTRHYRRGKVPQDIPWRATGERFDTMFPRLLVNRPWSTVTPMYRRTVTDAAGSWTELRQEEDWEYDCRIASLGTRIAYVDEFLADQRTHEFSSLRHAWMHDLGAMRDRGKARKLIFQHAVSAGISNESPEMQNFSRQLFHLSRQCGCMGLTEESKTLYYLSRTAAGESRARGMDYRCYGTLATVLGWRNTALLSARIERYRRVLTTEST